MESATRSISGRWVVMSGQSIASLNRSRICSNVLDGELGSRDISVRCFQFRIRGIHWNARRYARPKTVSDWPCVSAWSVSGRISERFSNNTSVRIQAAVSVMMP